MLSSLSSVLLTPVGVEGTAVKAVLFSWLANTLVIANRAGRQADLQHSASRCPGVMQMSVL